MTDTTPQEQMQLVAAIRKQSHAYDKMAAQIINTLMAVDGVPKQHMVSPRMMQKKGYTAEQVSVLRAAYALRMAAKKMRIAAQEFENVWNA